VIFTSPRAFDVHQVHFGKGDDTKLVCLAPDAIGMVPRDRRGGTVWSFDSEGERAVRPLRKAAIASLVRKFGVLDAQTTSDSPEGET
jgi:hypothetical protein